MKIVDSNVILRWLLEDDKRKADAFAHLLRTAAASKKDQLFIPEIGVAEIVWVLESHYKLSPEAIAQIIRNLLSTEGIVFENRERVFDSITLYENHKIDYIDAYLAALCKEQKMDGILSYDADFDKLPGVIRVEP